MEVDIPSLAEPTVATPFQLLSLTEKLPPDAASTPNCFQSINTDFTISEALQPITVTELTRMEMPQTAVELLPLPAQLSGQGRASPTKLGEFGVFHPSVLPSLSQCFGSTTASLFRSVDVSDELAIPGPSGTLVSLAQPFTVTGFSAQPVMVERPSVLQRSISSPLSTSAPAFFNDALPGMSSSVSETVHVALNERKEENARKRKKLVLSTNVKFPEATPPAIRPRFQWYQAKGLVRVHLLVRNVLPTNFRFHCNGRDLDFRVKADNCPYPPTRPENPPRSRIEYHLPLRLTHRVYVEPEFSRISPSRIEIHFKKVKPFVEWAALWKIPSPDGEKPEKNPMDETSEEEDSAGDSEEEENSPIRPSKRFVIEHGKLNREPAAVSTNGEPNGTTSLPSDGAPHGATDVEQPNPVSDQEMVLAVDSPSTKDIVHSNVGVEGPVELQVMNLINEMESAVAEGPRNAGGQVMANKLETDPYEFT